MKICKSKNCGHRKGEHKFYIIQGEVYCCCEECDCDNFLEKYK